MSKQASAVLKIPIRRLTRETFAAFGEVISLENLSRLPIDLYGDRIDAYEAAVLEADGPNIQLLLVHSKLREFRVHFLERHMEHTQTFIPLGGDPFLLVVARPDAGEQDGIPSFDEIAAFYVPGNVGIKMHRGTWHEGPFPLSDGCMTIQTSQERISTGLTSELSEDKEIHALDVDKRNVTERTGVRLDVELPSI